MKNALRPGPGRPAFFGLAALLLTLILGLTVQLQNTVLIAGAVAFVLILVATVHQLLVQAEARAEAGEASAAAAQDELRSLKSTQESRSTDLALLGRYGNLLIGCTDLAETLQISEQMLSLLLPASAGTIYPLLDGEGLAEATHLWGSHAADTQMQASAEDCWCMQRKRAHQAHSGTPELCAHILPPASDVAMTAACIPLVAQGESLGWIYLSTPGHGSFPKLHVACVPTCSQDASRIHSYLLVPLVSAKLN